ncbi:MAG: hypothetical protein OMM_05875 [Candidatus Magnetoglobus multicellularis str. Araruama]|uniref:Uncharacterized protein n=1 Tax=Candidatus Magnetoglobus multicellularis str. Araruama TaxID=890399 RepID=A0A1V1NTK2_9BACT|nr:MAG: hypothetical protein OMM_05875 [Candidatus Magnetoglobus multicellularis str. Araruama]
MTAVGNKIELPFKIHLQTGWNMFGYPSDTQQNALNAVQQLIDEKCLVEGLYVERLIKVVNNEGKSIIKFLGSWRNSIGDFLPGEGYRVKVLCDASFDINQPANSNKRRKRVRTLRSAQPASHFTKVWDGGATNPMTIYVVSATINGNNLSNGNEIAIYDGTNCVGAGSVDGEISTNSPFELITSKNDGSGNGFTVGNNITYKLWDGDNECTDITVSYMDLNGNSISAPQFTADESYIASLSCNMTTEPHFKPVWEGGATNPMTLYAISVTLNGNSLTNGEVGVFDGSKCVGSAIINAEVSSSNPLEIINSKDDGSGNGLLWAILSIINYGMATKNVQI